MIANLLLLICFGKTFLEAAGTRKIPSLAIALVTFGLSALYGMIDWQRGIFLLSGMIVGSYYGAKIAIAIGDVWMRRAVICFLVLSLVGLIWQ